MQMRRLSVYDTTQRVLVLFASTCIDVTDVHEIRSLAAHLSVICRPIFTPYAV